MAPAQSDPWSKPAHYLARSKVAVESLLGLLAQTSNDPKIRAYATAIEFYAQDIERVWPADAA